MSAIDLRLAEAVDFANALGVSLESLRYEPLTLLRAFAGRGPAQRAVEHALNAEREQEQARGADTTDASAS